MHELSVAQSIVQFLVHEADRKGSTRVAEVEVDVGEVMQIEVDVLQKALVGLMTGPRLEGARVGVSVQPALFSCQRCGSRWGMKEAREQLAGVSGSLLVREPDSDEVPLHFLPGLYTAFMSCPSCGSTDFSTVNGEDVRVVRLVLE